ncbi:MAG: putative toxin-antitoxin system toxin component, PIN family [Lachnospiraceae bacterium]|nr:putative toxin-antitoxin system toxin component, PIN family [Lachnospiraceae bacterium]
MGREDNMRVLVDTNVLFSALVFPRSRPAKALLHVANHHEIVLCDRNIAELRDILERKAPQYLPDAEVLLAELSYELIPAVDHAQKLIRDAKDQPILNAAIVSDVDIILTGDKDFLSLDMDHPKCKTVAEFLDDEGY